jgi:hypothetical protein
MSGSYKINVHDAAFVSSVVSSRYNKKFFLAPVCFLSVCVPIFSAPFCRPNLQYLFQSHFKICTFPSMSLSSSEKLSPERCLSFV